MGYGIGGGGQMGIALEVLPPPVQAASSTNASGGTLAAGTYRYYVTAINANGETLVSNEISQVTTGATSTVTVNWATVTGATGFRIYRTAVDGASGTELFLVAVGMVTTYIDTGALTPAGALPATNTAANPGVYVAPTKFVPFLSENLKYQQETTWRRPIRKSVSVLGAVPGDVHTEGDIEMEALEDVIPYFLRASRMSIVKTGTTNYVYTCTPNEAAVPGMTLSITIERVDGVVFGYTGCVVGSFKFNVDGGMLKHSVTIIGLDEASAGVPVPTWPTSTPYGAGSYDVQIPSGTTVFDTDTFEFSVDDAAEAQFRMKNTGRGAQFVKYGERTVTLSVERDFTSRADYDAYKAYTAQAITILASKGANNNIQIGLGVAIKDTYEVALGGQGDLVRGSISYQGTVDGSGDDYTLVVKTQENI